MSALRAAVYAGLASLLVSCAAHVDHFYTLSTLPDASGAVAPAADLPATGSPAAAFTAHLILSTSIPRVIDRPQMLVHISDDQVLILEHERWAAPLSELVAHTLARDIEQRRPGVLVGDRGFDQATAPAIKAKVDIVQMSARKGGRAVLEAHWRIVDPASDSDQLGGGVFAAPLNGDEYAAIAQAFSMCLASLSDKIAENLTEH
jgi:uncharacterized protein